MNNPRGSIWHRWDLHLHTPESLVHEYDGPDAWPQFIEELENLPPEFKVIGISDYIFLDGYRRILAERKKGRLQNIDLFLPVIELRLDKFGGSQGHLSKANYHIIFSDVLDPEVIEQQFLNALSSKYILLPQYDQFRTSGRWQAIPTKQSLTDLGRLIIGSVPEKERSRYNTPLREGFNGLCLNLKSIEEVLQSHYFAGKVIAAVGKTEWADIKWNDQSIAEKKNIINGADLVFISVNSADEWQKAKNSLKSQGVNDRIIDCSDAHYFSNSGNKDRIGNCLTWVKADPTFAGLQQALHEPDERIFLGDIPPQLSRVRTNPTKYISGIRIERKSSATIKEMWFDNTIPINPGLVAIIGNKGKGKSALTDTMGLLANTKQHKDFTFLSTDNFRQPKENKAKHFQATLMWQSGTQITKGLDEVVDEEQPELVKYIPQNFLEKICTQLGNIEESDFDRELKKVIFSHVRAADRLGTTSLDNLVSYRTAEANRRIVILKEELHEINLKVSALEARTQPEHRKTIENLIALKTLELEAHDNAKPAEIPKPENDPTKQKEISEIASLIEDEKRKLAVADQEIVDLTAQQGVLVRNIAAADRLLERLNNLERQIQTFANDSESDLTELGLKLADVMIFELKQKPISDKQKAALSAKSLIDAKLDENAPDNLISKRESLAAMILQLQEKLDEPNKKYQAYRIALANWEKQRSGIIGAEDDVDTLKYYERQLADLGNLPAELKTIEAQRLAKTREIYSAIKRLADTYRDLYAPVHTFIEIRPLAKDKFQLNFEVGILDTGFQPRFFEIVTQGVIGTFQGVEAGNKILKDMLAEHDFNTIEGVETFLAAIMEALQHDQRPGGRPTRVIDQLRTRKKTEMLYDLIFSLDYLKPRYALRMGDKELGQLSPGERGNLLLVFYLLLDKDDIPLVIDQPEENLDNQSVYELLVPCMKEAKQRRQVFIVTHNPNLAVVCDAEQVIRADLNKKSNLKMNYISGGIENPTINKAIVDVLEGTMPAFDNRQSKYFSPS